VIGPPAGLGTGPTAVLVSGDGGESWSSVKAQGLPSGKAFAHLTCPTSSECWLSGEFVHVPRGWQTMSTGGAVLSTANGGQTWRSSRLPRGAGWVLGVSCPTSGTCFALATQQQPALSGPPTLMLLVLGGPGS
jgi:photosystem II stability/assembly factor-like uncharacterized protein